jgi:hypothetical protein
MSSEEKGLKGWLSIPPPIPPPSAGAFPMRPVSRKLLSQQTRKGHLPHSKPYPEGTVHGESSSDEEGRLPESIQNPTHLKKSVSKLKLPPPPPWHPTIDVLARPIMQERSPSKQDMLKTVSPMNSNAKFETSSRAATNMQIYYDQGVSLQAQKVQEDQSTKETVFGNVRKDLLQEDYILDSPNAPTSNISSARVDASKKMRKVHFEEDSNIQTPRSSTAKVPKLRDLDQSKKETVSENMRKDMLEELSRLGTPNVPTENISGPKVNFIKKMGNVHFEEDSNIETSRSSTAKVPKLRNLVIGDYPTQPAVTLENYAPSSHTQVGRRRSLAKQNEASSHTNNLMEEVTDYTLRESFVQSMHELWRKFIDWNNRRSLKHIAASQHVLHTYHDSLLTGSVPVSLQAKTWVRDGIMGSFWHLVSTLTLHFLSP